MKIGHKLQSLGKMSKISAADPPPPSSFRSIPTLIDITIAVSEVPRMIATGDGFSLSVDRAALLNDRLLAPPSTDRATIDRWRSLAREHN